MNGSIRTARSKLKRREVDRMEIGRIVTLLDCETGGGDRHGASKIAIGDKTEKSKRGYFYHR